MSPALQPLLERFRSHQIDAAALSAAFHSAAADWPALPQRYHEVLGRLLMQVESSGLFSEESCSFSRADLADALGQWLAKAEQTAPR